MKILVIGDMVVSPDTMADAVKLLPFHSKHVVKLNWNTKTSEEFSQRILNIEKNGPESDPFPPELCQEIEDTDVLLVHFAPILAEIIRKANKLKLIGICRGGTENVDIESATKKGIPVIHVIRNAEEVAEFTIGLILTETRNIARGHEALKKGLWRKDFSNSKTISTIKGKKIGIIGLGHIGKLVAKKLGGFEVSILAYDPYVSEETLSNIGVKVEMVSLEKLFKESDVITIHARLTHSTQNMIDERLISLMKPTAYLINAARAGLLDEKAFCRALTEGRIAGAALDVFWSEPLAPDHILIKCDNVTLTPHLAGRSVDSRSNSPYLLAGAISDFLEKGNLDLVINAELVNTQKIINDLKDF